MEIVSNLLNLFGFSIHDGMKIKEESSLKSGFVELAEDVMKDMENPFMGILFGAAFTAVVQSSSATTGVLIVLAQQGLISLEGGIPVIFGANIGTCVTAALAVIGAERDIIGGNFEQDSNCWK